MSTFLLIGLGGVVFVWLPTLPVCAGALRIGVQKGCCILLTVSRDGKVHGEGSFLVPPLGLAAVTVIMAHGRRRSVLCPHNSRTAFVKQMPPSVRPGRFPEVAIAGECPRGSHQQVGTPKRTVLQNRPQDPASLRGIRRDDYQQIGARQTIETSQNPFPFWRLKEVDILLPEKERFKGKPTTLPRTERAGRRLACPFFFPQPKPCAMPNTFNGPAAFIGFHTEQETKKRAEAPARLDGRTLASWLLRVVRRQQDAEDRLREEIDRTPAQHS